MWLNQLPFNPNCFTTTQPNPTPTPTPIHSTPLLVSVCLRAIRMEWRDCLTDLVTHYMYSASTPYYSRPPHTHSRLDCDLNLTKPTSLTITRNSSATTNQHQSPVSCFLHISNSCLQNCALKCCHQIRVYGLKKIFNPYFLWMRFIFQTLLSAKSPQELFAVKLIRRQHNTSVFVKCQ